MLYSSAQCLGFAGQWMTTSIAARRNSVGQDRGIEVRYLRGLGVRNFRHLLEVRAARDGNLHVGVGCE